MWSSAVVVTFFLTGIASVYGFPMEARLQSRQQDLSPNSANSTIDWCAKAYNASQATTYGLFPASYALKCLQSLPYDQSIAESTIDTVSKMFNQFYAPESYVKQSSNPMVPIAVDLPASFSAIKDGIMNQSYSYFEYQYAITELIRSLNDGSAFKGHTLIIQDTQGIQMAVPMDSGSDYLFLWFCSHPMVNQLLKCA